MIDRYIGDEAAQSIKEEIHKAGGNEILFFCWTDDQCIVVRVEVVARGNEECVAIPLEKSFLPDVVIHNHPGGDLSPSDQDMRIASYVANRGVGFLIVNNEVSRVYAVVEPVLKERIAPLDQKKLRQLLSKDGPFHLHFLDFEEREGQLRMIDWVCESFNKNKVALIEAGTGIGKSIAYLLPAIQWSIANKERVVISTNTINLQEQLLFKDIPDLKTILDLDFSYLLMKGRGNYICLNRLFEAQQDLFSFIEDEELQQFEAIFNWVQRTEDGSLSDLTFIPKTALWEKINSQSDTCSGGACRYYSRCFLNGVRRKAVSANIIVTNHHYLIADACLAGSGGSILPSYERVVFDEAHNLEDSATSFFTKRISLGSIMRLLNRLYSGPKKKKGYLMYLSKRGMSESKIIDELMGEVSSLKSISMNLFDTVKDFLTSADILRMNTDSSSNGHTLLEINEQTRNLPGWDSVVCRQLGVFHRESTTVLNRLFQLREELEEENDERTGKQIEGFISRVGEIIQTIDIFLNEEDRRYVRWIEKKKEVACVVSLIDVGSTLNELIFRRLKSGILTSATLTVGGAFTFMKNRLSLIDSVLEAQIPSPFSYDKQMAVLIPTDVREPENPEYGENISNTIFKIVEKTRGKAFILFTSYKLLNEVFNRIKEEIENIGLVLFKQGNDSRNRLLSDFKLNIHSVLFGTESFWEGVDAPGQTLECVIITKLPFKVPTEPVTRARLERIKMDGGNPFLEYSLPLAVIKMKQGIGRLIRKKTDRGIIVILDRRILVRTYGTIFLRSLPGGNLFRGSLSDILGKVDPYLTNNSLTK